MYQSLKTVIYQILFFVSFLSLIVLLCLMMFVIKPQLSASPSNLDHLIGNHPGSCYGTLYTLNLSLSKGFLLLNITDVPECFLDANPTFPHENQSRLLQSSGSYQWIWN